MQATGPIAAILAALAIVGCGGGSTDVSPAGTVQTFLDSIVAGDGAKACSLATPHAIRDFVGPVSCALSVKQASGSYAPVIKQLTLGQPVTNGSTATVTGTIGGQRIIQFTLVKSGGKWLINGLQRIGLAGETSSPGPSAARITAITLCLKQRFSTPQSLGTNTVGGLTDVVLGVTQNGKTIAELEVFGSADDARAAYPTINQGFNQETKLLGDTVVAYPASLARTTKRALEACGR